MERKCSMHKAKQISHQPCSVAVKYLVSVEEENKIDGDTGMLAQKEKLVGNAVYFFRLKIYKLFYISIKMYNCCFVLIRRNRSILLNVTRQGIHLKSLAKLVSISYLIWLVLVGNCKA